MSKGLKKMHGGVRHGWFVLIFFLTLFLSLPSAATPAAATPTDSTFTDLPWAVFGYWGRMTNDDLGDVMVFDYTLNSEVLYSLELSHQLPPTNFLRHFFQPVMSTVEVAANFTYRDDPVGPIYEFDPYLMFRWANFPWKKYVQTSFAVGEGVSFDTKVPQVEQSSSDTNEGQQVLNYLMFELTFALPSHPNLELVWRIHHRSGVFGLYNAENTGSTAVGVGVRYRF